MSRILLISALCFSFCASQPLSEVIKDIEVSGEARYRFESDSYKKQKSQKALQNASKKAQNN